MDGQRFDNFTRRLGSGLNRRQMLRGLIGGAGAVAATTLIREQAEAACNPSLTQVACPEGSAAPVGSQGGLEGFCCNGHGNCCGRNCVDGTCGPAVVPACDACTDQQTCCNGVCLDGVDQTCCETDADCPDGCQSCSILSGNEVGICTAACAVECCYAGIEDPADWYCRAEDTDCCYDEDCAEGEACINNFCVPPCLAEGEECEDDADCCDDLICPKGVCEEPADCTPEKGGCKADSECCKGLVCVDGVCAEEEIDEVEKLPSTGSGAGPDGSSAIGVTLATGAAALVAAKVLRSRPVEGSSTES